MGDRTAKQNRPCPVCGNTKWDYDTADGWFIYCGSCWESLRQYGMRHEMMCVSPNPGLGLVFKSFKHYLRALAGVSRIDKVNTCLECEDVFPKGDLNDEGYCSPCADWIAQERATSEEVMTA